MFFGGLAFAGNKSVVIEDGKYETFLDMINFIYCEKELSKYASVDSSEKILDLLELSYFGHKYQILALTNYTSHVINNNIALNTENVIPILQDVNLNRLSAESECFIIENFCFNFIDNNMDKIFFKDGPTLPVVS